MCGNVSGFEMQGESSKIKINKRFIRHLPSAALGAPRRFWGTALVMQRHKEPRHVGGTVAGIPAMRLVVGEPQVIVTLMN